MKNRSVVATPRSIGGGGGTPQRRKVAAAATPRNELEASREKEPGPLLSSPPKLSRHSQQLQRLGAQDHRAHHRKPAAPPRRKKISKRSGYLIRVGFGLGIFVFVWILLVLDTRTKRQGGSGKSLVQERQEQLRREFQQHRTTTQQDNDDDWNHLTPRVFDYHSVAPAKDPWRLAHIQTGNATSVVVAKKSATVPAYMIHNWCPQPVSNLLESPRLVLASDYATVVEPNRSRHFRPGHPVFHYANVEYDSFYEHASVNYRPSLDNNDAAATTNVTFTRMPAPFVPRAAVCRIRSSVTNKLQHFAHAMEEIYKCFGYWIDHSTTTASGNGTRAAVTPVLLYDEATQGKFLLHDSFLKNPFMAGIRDFLVAELGLVLLSSEEYFRCHHHNGGEPAAGGTPDASVTEVARRLRRDEICQAYYHPNQTLRTFEHEAETGYYFRHVREWNELTTSYLQKNRRVELSVEEAAQNTATPTFLDRASQKKKRNQQRREQLLANHRIREAQRRANETPPHKPKQNQQQPPSRGGKKPDLNYLFHKAKQAAAPHHRRRLSLDASSFAPDPSANSSSSGTISHGATPRGRRLTASSSSSSTKKSVCMQRPRIGILNRFKTRMILNADDLAADLSNFRYVYEKSNERPAANNNNNSTVETLYAKPSPVEVAFFENKTFVEQVEFFRRTDILISGHGAQLTGLAFMANDLDAHQKSCKQVLEFFPKNYALPYYFGSLAVQSGLGHSYVYYDDGLGDRIRYRANPTDPRPPPRDLRRKRDPLKILKPWERVSMTEYKERVAARKFKFCPRRNDVVDYAVQLIREWYRCRGC